MKAVILAGGKGARLRPLTYTIPKPLLPIGEKPILEEIIDRLRDDGFGEVVIAVGYRAELIETYFRDGSHLGVKIEYVRETTPLGTAGPLALVRDSCELDPDESLLVMNGDLLTDLKMSGFLESHRRSGADFTVATREYVLQHPYGVIHHDDGRITDIVEKPTITDTVSAGIYALQPSALDGIPSGEIFDIPALMNQLLSAGKHVAAHAFTEAWLAIDGHEQLEDAGRILAARDA